MTDDAFSAMSGDPMAELDAARGRVQAQLQETRARNEALHSLAEQTAEATATVRSPRGELEVTAEAGGRIRAVRFAGTALDLTPADLGRLTTQTIVAAQRAAAEAALAAVESTLGPSPGLEDLRREIRDRF